MPRVTIKSPAAARLDRRALMQRASEKASDILRETERVLVVYAGTSASLYYDEDTRSSNKARA
jgi:hypothetical protein